ncbi:hypothetical protein HOT57_gp10 [Pseudomonas phage phCDa]|uniref:N4 gp53-like protein n=1 Tax=Pseudomonas phage phCDa TaxID=2268587 RepID=A0A2Z5H912_9CAUD|nr:hypothetical protein HOT57_gp10 [Pseudomonas phage phCDa]AXC36454.1 hypothetical protein phCDa_10 [Pseudomonas phage phCDa]
MGLFSDKKKYTVNVTTQPVFEEGQIPTSALNGIIKGVLQETDIVPTMLDELVGSIGIRAMTGIFNTKAKPYNVGIPKAQVATYIQAKDQVVAAISANIGRAITPEYYYMGPLNSMHFGWQHCYDALGYNAQTNELTLVSAQVGFPCYLTDIIATYLRADYDWMVETNDLGMLAQLGPSPRSGYRPSAPFNVLSGIGQYAEQPAFEVSDVATEDYVTIEYEFQDDSGAFVQRGMTVSMAAFENIADYHMCRYVDTTGRTGFFTYLHNSGTYPSIDLAYAMEDSTLGTYFPWVYFRLQGEDVTFVETRETIKQMRDWCSTIGVNYDTLHDGVLQDPNLGDVEQSLLMMAVKPGNANQACREYLFKHFSALHANAQSQSVLDPTLAGRMDNFTSSPSQYQRIQDNRFAMTLQFSGITKRRLIGSIGKIRTYNSHFGIMSQDKQSFLTQTPEGSGVGSSISNQPGWVYQYQVTDTIYEEIIVYGLRANYEVHRKKGYAAGAQSTNLLIPLDSEIVKTLSVPAREQLLCRSLILVVNTVLITTTPWYASSAFKIVLLVIAVVVTIFSGGTAWQSIVAAASLGATALIITVLTLIVQAVMVSLAVKLFVKVAGPKFALIVAIVAVLYGNSTAASTQLSSSWAQNLVQVGTALVSEAATVSQEQIAAGIQNIVDDAVSFSEWAQDQYDGLAAKMQELGLIPSIVGLEAFDVVKMGPQLVLGESPGDYYNRTVHAGNIGALSFDMTENYVAVQTQLPTFNQTRETFING